MHFSLWKVCMHCFWRLICKRTVYDKAYRCKKIDTFCTQNYCPVRKIYTVTPTLSAKCFFLILTSYFPTVCVHTHTHNKISLITFWDIPIFFDSWFVRSLVMNSVSVSSENKEVTFTSVVPPVWMWRKAVCIKEILLLSSPHLSSFYWSKMAHENLSASINILPLYLITNDFLT